MKKNKKVLLVWLRLIFWTALTIATLYYVNVDETQKANYYLIILMISVINNGIAGIKDSLDVIWHRIYKLGNKEEVKKVEFQEEESK